MSQLAKGKSKARDPPPSLFLHHSPAASHVSLPGHGGTHGPPSALTTGIGSISGIGGVGGVSSLGSQAPALQYTSSLRQSEQAPNPTRPEAVRKISPQTPLFTAGLGGLQLPLKLRQDSTRATDRTDALWAEMQATLEEVELSASGGTRVFGPDHDHKLAELRAAQIALAQAWARSEADEAIETTISTDGDVRHSKPVVPGAKEGGTAGDSTAGKAEGAGSTAAGSVRPGSAGVGTERLGAKMEEETEVDILLARKRREANDRYFQRVNQGVLDVVAKLDDVAVAMRAVEQESKDIWGENENDQESIAGSAKT